MDDNISQQHFVLSSHLKNDKVTKILDKIIHLPEAISLDDFAFKINCSKRVYCLKCLLLGMFTLDTQPTAVHVIAVD